MSKKRSWHAQEATLIKEWAERAQSENPTAFDRRMARQLRRTQYAVANKRSDLGLVTAKHAKLPIWARVKKWFHKS